MKTDPRITDPRITDRRIVAIEQGEAAAVAIPDADQLTGEQDGLLPLDAGPDEDLAPPDQPATPRDTIAAAAAIAAVIGWTGFFVSAHWPRMRGGADAAQWSDWITAWAVPLLLVIGLWLLARRHSRTEAGRFNDATTRLRDEAAALEHRLTGINRELSLAREFLAAQGRDLETLGRVAAERLGEHAARLQDLVGSNGERVDRLADVSAAALDNMERLRGQLPVLTNAARDLTNNIGHAGRGAQEQLDALAEGFVRIADAGRTSEEQVEALRVKVGAALTEFRDRTDQLGAIANARFGALDENSARLREALDQQEAEALAAIHARADALGETLRASRAQLTREEDAALAGLRERLARLDDDREALARQLREGEASALSGWRERVEALSSEAEHALARLDDTTRETLDSAGQRIATLSAEIERVHGDFDRRGEAFESGLAERMARSQEQGRAMADALAARLEALDATIEERRIRHEAASAAIARHAEAITGQLTDYGARMEDVAEHGAAAEAAISAGLARLNQQLGASREALSGMDDAVAETTASSTRLLELIEASAGHAVEQLPAALAGAEAQLAGLGERVTAMRDALGAASESGRALDTAVAATREATGAALTELHGLHDALQGRNVLHAEQMLDLRESLAAARVDSEAMAASAESALRDAIAELSAAAQRTGQELEEASAGSVRALAERLGTESGAAIERALDSGARDVIAGAIAGIDAAVGRAAEAGREATGDMREQLARIEELTGHLEQRIARARQQAEEDVGSHFASRVAQISDSLNATAIDISKALSAEISETSWKRYMRGERGLFTRRAVRLLDSAEAHAVREHYQTDDDFRQNVSRYITDFEAMMRNLLSTREGDMLAVTVLSSDMGKLYVALAQAIERLRQ